MPRTSCVARNKYGIMTQVTQTLRLEDTPKINSRFFNEGKTLCLWGTRKSAPGCQSWLSSLFNVCGPMWTLAFWPLDCSYQESISGC